MTTFNLIRGEVDIKREKALGFSSIRNQNVSIISLERQALSTDYLNILLRIELALCFLTSVIAGLCALMRAITIWYASMCDSESLPIFFLNLCTAESHYLFVNYIGVHTI